MVAGLKSAGTFLHVVNAAKPHIKTKWKEEKYGTSFNKIYWYHWI